VYPNLWLTLTNLWQLAPLHITWLQAGESGGDAAVVVALGKLEHKLGDFRDRSVIYGR